MVAIHNIAKSCKGGFLQSTYLSEFLKTNKKPSGQLVLLVFPGEKNSFLQMLFVIVYVEFSPPFLRQSSIIIIIIGVYVIYTYVCIEADLILVKQSD